MKNRRNLIVAFLLCACLIVGIGYAALTTNLYLNGSSIINGALAEEKFDTDIVWKSVESSNTAKVKAELDSTKDTITITADGLNDLTETITVTCVMVNNSTDTNAWVTVPAYVTAGDATPYIKVTRTQTGVDDEGAPVTITSASGDLATEKAFYLEANGGTATVEITFQLIKSFVPTDTLVEVKNEFKLTFNVEAIDNATVNG